jgi:hypothetical protein
MPAAIMKLGNGHASVFLFISGNKAGAFLIIRAPDRGVNQYEFHFYSLPTIQYIFID